MKEIEIIKLHLPEGIVATTYKPHIIIDGFNNEYVILSKYIAGNLRTLLQTCHKLKLPFSSGDWWDDTLAYIPEDWAGNTSVENLETNYYLWLKEQNKTKHTHIPSKERHAVQLTDWQTIEIVRCSECGILYKI